MPRSRINRSVRGAGRSRERAGGKPADRLTSRPTRISVSRIVVSPEDWQHEANVRPDQFSTVSHFYMSVRAKGANPASSDLKYICIHILNASNTVINNCICILSCYHRTNKLTNQLTNRQTYLHTHVIISVQLAHNRLLVTELPQLGHGAPGRIFPGLSYHRHTHIHLTHGVLTTFSPSTNHPFHTHTHTHT